VRILYIAYTESRFPEYFPSTIRIGYIEGFVMAMYKEITLQEWSNQGGE
jgi:hypothetical protein